MIDIVELDHWLNLGHEIVNRALQDAITNDDDGEALDFLKSPEGQALLDDLGSGVDLQRLEANDDLEWLAISGFERYEISNDGQVRTRARTITIAKQDKTFPRKVKARSVRTYQNGKARAYVIIHDGQSYRRKTIEALLALAIQT